MHLPNWHMQARFASSQFRPPCFSKFLAQVLGECDLYTNTTLWLVARVYSFDVKLRLSFHPEILQKSDHRWEFAFSKQIRTQTWNIKIPINNKIIGTLRPSHSLSEQRAHASPRYRENYPVVITSRAFGIDCQGLRMNSWRLPSQIITI